MYTISIDKSNFMNIHSSMLYTSFLCQDQSTIHTRHNNQKYVTILRILGGHIHCQNRTLPLCPCYHVLLFVVCHNLQGAARISGFRKSITSARRAKELNLVRQMRYLSESGLSARCMRAPRRHCFPSLQSRTRRYTITRKNDLIQCTYLLCALQNNAVRGSTCSRGLKVCHKRCSWWWVQGAREDEGRGETRSTYFASSCAKKGSKTDR